MDQSGESFDSVGGDEGGLAMKRIGQIERRSLLCHLVAEMRDVESWAGETQIQKSVMFLQELLGVPLGYEFVLYKHGPFSFDLRSELALMRARLQLDVEPNLHYGPSFIPGVRGLLAIKAPTRHENAIKFVAEKVSVKDTRPLERISTAFFLQEKLPLLSSSQIASEIDRLKPHISIEQAHFAVQEVDALRLSAPQAST